jgi:hypothetical protein
LFWEEVKKFSRLCEHGVGNQDALVNAAEMIYLRFIDPESVLRIPVEVVDDSEGEAIHEEWSRLAHDDKLKSNQEVFAQEIDKLYLQAQERALAHLASEWYPQYLRSPEFLRLREQLDQWRNQAVVFADGKLMLQKTSL